jgi:hypothetical protein
VAKVFADNFVLNYTGAQKFLTLVKTLVYDAGGNNNGQLDPGETVNLTASLKNIGGVAFTGLNTTLSETSSYITVTDAAGYFGRIGVDTTKENTGDVYALQVASNTPQGHLANFRIIAAETGFCDTFDFSLVVGKFHYYVWNPDPTPSSGQIIDSLLRNLNYNGTIGTALPTRGALDLYRAVFVCAGIYPNNRLITAGGSEATTLTDYLASGGRLFMEGGDVWYYDPLIGGHDFCSLFGVSAVADGSSDLGPVAGQSGTFTRNQNFTYAGENNFMDHISPSGTGAFLVFKDGDSLWDCGVAQNTGAYRTVAQSFELGGLTDATGYSRKVVLVDSIMKFFGILPVGVDESAAGSRPIGRISLSASPNPFAGETEIRWQMADMRYGATNNGKGILTLTVYDASGRRVKSFTDLTTDIGYPTSVIWRGEDAASRAVPAGIYFIKLRCADQTAVEKVIRLQ